MVGLDMPYNTWKHDTMFVLRPPEMGPSHPTVIDFPKDLYFRPEGNLTLIGLEDGNPFGTIARCGHRPCNRWFYGTCD